MRNKYPGICYRCGCAVAAGAGHFERLRGSIVKWRVQHADCAIHHRGRDVPPLTHHQDAAAKEQA